MKASGLLLASVDTPGCRWPIPRVEAQHGFMTICGRILVDHNDAMDQLPSAHEIRRGRVVINSGVKASIVEELECLNVNATTLLYPGVDIAARAIARAYEKQ